MGGEGDFGFERDVLEFAANGLSGRRRLARGRGELFAYFFGL